MKPAIVGALALVLVAVAVPSMAPGATFSEGLRALALERSGGDLTQLGVMVSIGPDGPVEAPISGEEFLARAAVAMGRAGTGPQADHAVVPGGYGIGISNPHVAQRLGWPFCDTVAMFVMYFGQPGSAIAEMVRAPGPVGAGSSCGMGASYLWSDVTFDARHLSVLFGPCIAAIVVGPLAERPVGLTGGYVCSGSLTCGAGSAAVMSLSFFGIALDIYTGNDGYVLSGDQAAVALAPGCAPGIPGGI